VAESKPYYRSGVTDASARMMKPANSLESGDHEVGKNRRSAAGTGPALGNGSSTDLGNERSSGCPAMSVAAIVFPSGLQFGVLTLLVVFRDSEPVVPC